MKYRYVKQMNYVHVYIQEAIKIIAYMDNLLISVPWAYTWRGVKRLGIYAQ
jgi:hypothetical protein